MNGCNTQHHHVSLEAADPSLLDAPESPRLLSRPSRGGLAKQVESPLPTLSCFWFLYYLQHFPLWPVCFPSVSKNASSMRLLVDFVDHFIIITMTVIPQLVEDAFVRWKLCHNQACTGIILRGHAKNRTTDLRHNSKKIRFAFFVWLVKLKGGCELGPKSKLHFFRVYAAY